VSECRGRDGANGFAVPGDRKEESSLSRVGDATNCISIRRHHRLSVAEKGLVLTSVADDESYERVVLASLQYFSFSFLPASRPNCPMKTFDPHRMFLMASPIGRHKTDT
jgi:hypothetical protein